jgi:uncharacterized damage-inducible protein DinB
MDTLYQALADTATRVLEAFDAPEEELANTYSPGKWTARELLVHLADCEAVYLWRVSRAIAEPGSVVHGFDQDAWADRLDYAHRPLEPCKQLFEAARIQILDHADRIPEGDPHILHSERGKIGARDLLAFIVWHTEHHLGQIAAARTGQPWAPAP